MPNRLANENSPYLLQHKDNPVDWYPWGEEALERARREDKPIFLSIGYAACHWCHVMEHESFEDPETAALMNEHFVNVKVDREERPDLDNIYMQAVVAMTGQGGWPMSVFLTPEGKPFFGGTYFPPTRRFQMPSFREVLLGVANAWKQDRERAERAGDQLRDHLQKTITPLQSDAPLSTETVQQALMKLAQEYDWKHGGWGRAPKFPQPMTIDFLLSQATRGDKLARDMATHALDQMAKGGMYDVVGGGFARYSVDDRWLVPHFEKMLYDNAQLARVYLHAHLVTGNPSYRRVVEETLSFVMREMTDPAGGFFSSLDADSEGEEGKYYVWTPNEVREAIHANSSGEAGIDLAALVIRAYGITPSGNFEGRNVLQRQRTDDELAEEFGISTEEVPPYLQEAHRALLAAREKRVRPGLDDKVLVSWNGLMLVAFAEAGRYLGVSDYVKVATRNANFLLSHLIQDGRLLRVWREGRANQPGFLEDYASLALALLTLYQTDHNPRWFQEAQRLAEILLADFRDPEGGFFDTSNAHENLLLRLKDVQDNATPSGNALATSVLLLLAAFTGEGKWYDLAQEALSTLQPALTRYPTAFAQWLCAMDFALGPVQEIAILGDPQDRERLLQVVWEQYNPRRVIAAADVPPPPGSPPLLDNRPLLNGRTTAYVCQHFVCRQPVSEPGELRQQLEQV